MSEETPLDFEAAWSSWFASSVRQELQEGITTELERASGTFEVEDGTHAKWNGEHLGVLTVFTTDEVIALLCAWEEAERGNWLAQKEMLIWLEKWMQFITCCVEATPPDRLG
ncbi:MAG: hypothetical protein QF878_10645 [SAR202 cluster bacterium]|nr:hypothetical protein [SAR202 cluster bacterium]